MGQFVDVHGDDALNLLLSTLRERAGRCADGLQISSRTMRRLLKEKFGREACYSLYIHAVEILVTKRILTLFDETQRRKVFWINARRIPTVVAEEVPA